MIAIRNGGGTRKAEGGSHADHCVCDPEGRLGEKHDCLVARGSGAGNEREGLRHRHGPARVARELGQDARNRRHRGRRLGRGAPAGPSGLAQGKGFTLAIIDTPGAEGPASAAAMVVADLNIIPSRPSMFDLWASAKTRAALKDVGGDFVFLLNQCPPAQQTARVQDGVETLEEMGGLISPLDPRAGRLSGSGPPRLGRHRAQSQRRRGRGNARSLGVDPAPSRPRQAPTPRARRRELRGGRRPAR